MVNEHEIDRIVDDINTDQSKTEGFFGKLEADLAAWWDEHFHSKSPAPISAATKTALNTIMSNAVMSAMPENSISPVVNLISGGTLEVLHYGDGQTPQASSVSSIAGSSSIETAVS